jgi:hypothetical protein
MVWHAASFLNGLVNERSPGECRGFLFSITSLTARVELIGTRLPWIGAGFGYLGLDRFFRKAASDGWEAWDD